LPKTVSNKPQDTSMDPMEEATTFNRPLESMALEASDSPLLSVKDGSVMSALPELSSNANRASTTSLTSSQSQTSSESRPSDVGSQDAPSMQSQKRARRRLTKNKGGSDVSVQEQTQPLSQPSPPPPLAERTSAERPRGVLTKKPPQRVVATAAASSTSSAAADDGRKIENVPHEARAEEDSNTAPSQSSSSFSIRDRLFPS
jgi:hypothetical protein